MHRNRTWTLDPSEWRTQRNRVLATEGGDGSALTLNFTNGVLDPRLTLSRAGNATFINSSGYVDYAPANMLKNSTMSGGSTSGLTAPTGWAVNTSGSSYRTQIVIDGCQQWEQVGTAQRPFITVTIPNTEIAAGIEYVASVYVDSVTTGSGFDTVGSMLYYNTPAGTTISTIDWIAPDGTISSGGSQPLVTGRLQMRFVLSVVGSSGFQIRIGIGTSNTATGTVRFSRPQLELGISAKTYIPNSSTATGLYNTPRFDYDPTTATLRGLLLEGPITNQLQNSGRIYTGSWGSSVQVTASQDTTIIDPANSTNTCKLVKTASSQYVVRNQVIPTVTVPANSTVYITASVWLKMNAANQTAPSIGIYDSGGTAFGTRSGTYVSNPAVTASSGSGADVDFTFGTVTGWVRVGVTRSITNSTGSPVSYTTLAFYIYPDRLTTNAATIYAWGAQVELSAAPSSYVPTGTNTASRVGDYLISSTSISSSRSTEWNLDEFVVGTSSLDSWTVYVDYNVNSFGTTSYPAACLIQAGIGTSVADFRHFTGGPYQISSAIRGTTIQTRNNQSGSRNKIALSANNTAQPTSAINGLGQTGTGTIPVTTGLQWVQFVNSTQVAGPPFNSICIREFKLWSSGKTAAELANITT